MWNMSKKKGCLNSSDVTFKTNMLEFLFRTEDEYPTHEEIEQSDYKVSTIFAGLTIFFFDLIVNDLSPDKVYFEIAYNKELSIPSNYIPIINKDDSNTGEYYYMYCSILNELKNRLCIDGTLNVEEIPCERLDSSTLYKYPFIASMPKSHQLVAADNVFQTLFESQPNDELLISESNEMHDRGIYFLNFALEVISKNVDLENKYSIDIEYLYLFMLIFYFDDIIVYLEEADYEKDILDKIIDYFSRQLDEVFFTDLELLNKFAKDNLLSFSVLFRNKGKRELMPEEQKSSISFLNFKEILDNINLNRTIVIKEFERSSSKYDVDKYYKDHERLYINRFLASNEAYLKYIRQ